MSNVVKFPGPTRLDVPAERVLSEAAEELKGGSVVLVGYTKDGEEYMASSLSDGGDVLWLIERLKKTLLETAD